MKNLYFSIHFLLLFSLCSSAQNLAGNDSICLKLQGKVLNITREDGHCKVLLLYKDVAVDSAFLKNGKKYFTFYLQRDRSYSVRLSMAGHIDKLVTVNTKNAAVAEEDDLHCFIFETSLLQEEAALRINTELAEHPIAIISFDRKRDKFDYDKEYTSNMKREMYLSSSK